MTQVGRSSASGWHSHPSSNSHPANCHQAAVRGAGPTAKLLLFIHRLCLLQLLPSVRLCPPPPTPSPPHLIKGAGSQTAWMEPVSCSEWARDPVAERWEQAVFGLRVHIFVCLISGLPTSMCLVWVGSQDGVGPAKEPCLWPLWSLGFGHLDSSGCFQPQSHPGLPSLAPGLGLPPPLSFSFGKEPRESQPCPRESAAAGKHWMGLQDQRI